MKVKSQVVDLETVNKKARKLFLGFQFSIPTDVKD